MSSNGPLGATERSLISGWDRARLNVVIVVGAIVAAAILCVVAAVLAAAQRADDAGYARERELLANSLTAYGERVLRTAESIGTGDRAIRNIREEFNPDWVHRRLGDWLQQYFEHDFVFVLNGQDRMIYSLYGQSPDYANWFDSVRQDAEPMIEALRAQPVRAQAGGPLKPQHLRRISAVHTFMGRPAIIAALLVTRDGGVTPSMTDLGAPLVLTIKFINDDVLTGIGRMVGLRNLRRVAVDVVPPGDVLFDFGAVKNRMNVHLAWTPKRPGAEIVDSVVPFVLFALGGFAALAGFVLRHMRRTEDTIAKGESQLHHLAMHDPLCGLPNRIFFAQRLEATIEQAQHGAPGAVFYIDLDHFKEINDTLGHPTGDALLRQVADRLLRTVDVNHIVARLGGDEFAVLAVGTIGEDTLLAYAQRIINELSAPYDVNGQIMVIGASIGVAAIHERDAAGADILRYADMALYRAKNEGRNRACIYDSAMNASLLARKQMESDLRVAVEHDALDIAYQPVMSANGATMVSVEALARWKHPLRGDISPAEFIPVAEHSGLIIELGEQVLRRACIAGKAWPGLTVAVNVSPLQFRRTDFVEMVQRILDETGFEPERLELEITETMFMSNIEPAEAAMRRLKAVGVRLALDDFGTGYSSLAYLRRFPFDRLKIDHSFVRSIENAPDAAAIIHAVVSLSRGLGIKVTAEGVETADQQLFLRAAGVHNMQGYRFGKPMPAADITSRLLRDAAASAPAEARQALAG